jgi:hypothetical protein
VKSAALAVLLVAVVAAGCGNTKAVTRTVTIGGTAKSGVGPPEELAEFGYIKSLQQKGSRFELRFDPAWFLSGMTASRAALEDTGSSDVPNDNYVVNESHRALTYLVPPAAHVTVLTRGGDPSQFGATPISVSQLAQIVGGKNPLAQPLFEPIETGFWIRFHNDTVRALDQQYRP